MKQWFNPSAQSVHKSEISTKAYRRDEDGIVITPKGIRKSIYTVFLFTALFLSFIAVKNEWLTNVESYVISITVGVVYLVVWYTDTTKSNPLDVRAISIYLILFWIYINLFALVYGINMYGSLAETEYEKMKWTLTFALLGLAFIPVVYISDKRILDDLKEDFVMLKSVSNHLKWRAIALICGWIVFVAVTYILFKFTEMKLAMIFALMVALLVLYFLSFYTFTHQSFEFKRLKLVTLLVLITMVAPLVIIIFFLPMIEQLDASIYGGVITSFTGSTFAGATNYFDLVFYLLLQSETASIMIAFMLIGATATMVIINMGYSGRILASISSSIIVIVPMFFVFLILGGTIPPPEFLSDIVGVSAGSVIYALAQISAFILVLGIILAFITASDMLQMNLDDD